MLFVQVEALVDWLLSRGRELKASTTLGPQALGTTAAALARQQAQRRQQQQEIARQQQLQQQQKAWQQQQQEESKHAAAAAERRVLLQQLVDAAVAQRGRLTPQVGNDVRIDILGEKTWTATCGNDTEQHHSDLLCRTLHRTEIVYVVYFRVALQLSHQGTDAPSQHANLS